MASLIKKYKQHERRERERERVCVSFSLNRKALAILSGGLDGRVRRERKKHYTNASLKATLSKSKNVFINNQSSCIRIYHAGPFFLHL